MPHPALMQLFAGTASATAPWTPAELDGISLKAWYDASDTATITDAGSGAVSAWADKSSNNFDLSQATGGVRPTTGAATLNGLNVLTFAGDYIDAASAADWKFLHDGTEHCVVAVVKFGTTANPAAAYGLFGTNGAGSGNIGATGFFDDRGGIYEEGVRHMITRGVGGSSVVLNESANAFDTVPANEWGIVTILGDADNGAGSGRSSIIVNRGFAIALNTATNPVSASNPTYVLSIGSTGNAVLPLTGWVAELVFTTEQDDRFDIEQYLAAKWGVAPYALAPAIVQVE